MTPAESRLLWRALAVLIPVALAIGWLTANWGLTVSKLAS